MHPSRLRTALLYAMLLLAGSFSCLSTVIKAQKLNQTTVSFGRFFFLLSSTSAPDGMIVSSGYNLQGNDTGVVMKTDASGTLLWAQGISIEKSKLYLNSVATTSSGTILALGTPG